MNIEVTISTEAFDVVMRHARTEAPLECCGMLLGKETVIEQAVPARNLSADADRYVIDPQDHVEAMRAARARALDVIGFFHSHPHSSAHASSADVAEISYPGCLYLIVGLGTLPPEIRVFRATASTLEEVDTRRD